MATKMMQFRYYKDYIKGDTVIDDSVNYNYPETWDWTRYCTTDSFKKYSPIISLGI